METFRVHFDERERDTVLTILSRSNDIVINTVEPTSVAITIQKDNANDAYNTLLDQIDRELRGPEGIIIPERRPDAPGEENFS
jgi:hypothetical protein